ncbi:MAG: hypothetical protein IKN81_04165 [Oscillospiraceae bacterium]|nr:hypothetical protein [Oscillospiraceae bacterium]
MILNPYIRKQDGFPIVGPDLARMWNCIVFSSSAPFTVSAMDGKKNWNGTVEYKNSDADWAVWDSTVTLNAPEGYLALRGIANTGFAKKTDKTFVIQGENVRCDGNIQTLLDYAAVAAGTASTAGRYAFYGMFYSCTALISAPELPATTLGEDCYENMFYNCKSLLYPPALPATTLAERCYANMFRECHSLKTVPALPATTLAEDCYASMFRNCLSLKTVPMLPALTLPEWCYSDMFYNCQALKLSITQSSEYPYAYRIPTAGTGTSQSTSLCDMFDSTGGTFMGTPDINTTYYTALPPVTA